MAEGVDPDVPVEKPAVSPLIQSLQNKSVIFDYATVYKLKHPTIAPSAEFKLTDQDYAEFVAYAKKRDYSYKTESDKLLDKLRGGF
jgi:carboxyl-terminal processing protease